MSIQKLNYKSLYLYLSISMAPLLLGYFSLQSAHAQEIKSGKQVYEIGCAGCHASGVLDAPKFGTNADWLKREQQGFETLVKHALNGFNNMPAKGGNPAYKNEEIIATVAYMLSESGFPKYADRSGEKPAAKEAATPKPAAKPAVVAQASKPAAAKSYKNTNRFNRLLAPSSEWNPPPAKDGIHDPENDGTEMLQQPKVAFEPLANSTSGNRVDWVKALHNGEINPRYDRLNPDAVPVVMDLNIVREVKGSMPNVVYPHKQHTEWLDCSNCHPAIFIPQKGANQISMAAILLGQKCGVCHGKVAFPVSECRKCHSQAKTAKK